MTMFGPYPAEIVDFHDGDTCHMTLDLGFGIFLGAPISCRIYGINAPELKKRKADPDGPGEAARAYAVSICPPGSSVIVTSHGWDKYKGRFDGTITMPDGDFAQKMLDAGHAVVMVIK